MRYRSLGASGETILGKVLKGRRDQVVFDRQVR